jgi:hypothetical protein
MLYVRVEIWPFGSKERRRVLGEAYIINNGEKLGQKKQDYIFRISKHEGFGPRGGNVWKKGSIKNFPRERLGPWDLIRRAVAAARGEDHV